MSTATEINDAASAYRRACIAAHAAEMVVRQREGRLNEARGDLEEKRRTATEADKALHDAIAARYDAQQGGQA